MKDAYLAHKDVNWPRLQAAAKRITAAAKEVEHQVEEQGPLVMIDHLALGELYAALNAARRLLHDPFDS